MDGPVWQYHVDKISELEARAERAEAAMENEAIVTRELRAVLALLRRPHLAVEGDPWFSCPKHPEYAGTQKPDICDCGADEYNAIIDKALAL